MAKACRQLFTVLRRILLLVVKNRCKLPISRKCKCRSSIELHLYIAEDELSVNVKGKGFPYLLPCIGPRDKPQCTGSLR